MSTEPHTTNSHIALSTRQQGVAQIPSPDERTRQNTNTFQMLSPFRNEDVTPRHIRSAPYDRPMILAEALIPSLMDVSTDTRSNDTYALNQSHSLITDARASHRPIPPATSLLLSHLAHQTQQQREDVVHHDNPTQRQTVIPATTSSTTQEILAQVSIPSPMDPSTDIRSDDTPAFHQTDSFITHVDNSQRATSPITSVLLPHPFHQTQYQAADVIQNENPAQHHISDFHTALSIVQQGVAQRSSPIASIPHNTHTPLRYQHVTTRHTRSTPYDRSMILAEALIPSLTDSSTDTRSNDTAALHQRHSLITDVRSSHRPIPRTTSILLSHPAHQTQYHAADVHDDNAAQRHTAIPQIAFSTIQEVAAQLLSLNTSTVQNSPVTPRHIQPRQRSNDDSHTTSTTQQAVAQLLPQDVVHHTLTPSTSLFETPPTTSETDLFGEAVIPSVPAVSSSITQENDTGADSLSTPQRPTTHITRQQHDSSSYASLGSITDRCHYCGAQMYPAERISRTRNSTYLYGSLCCNNGQLHLPLIPPPPPFIKELLQGTNSASRTFLGSIRVYNSALSMASMVCDSLSVPGSAPQSFRIQGSIYRFIGPLYTSNSRIPRGLQTYLYDNLEQLQHRLNASPAPERLNRSLLTRLQHTLQNVNPYVRSFRSVHKLISSNLINPINVSLTIHPNSSTHNHPGRYNVPSSENTEIAILIPGTDTPHPRSIVIQDTSDRLSIISELHRSYDPLHYVLFFANGTDGWHDELRLPNGKRVSACDFYAYHLHQRDTFNPLLYGRRLFQQYLVDMYVKIESSRLHWVRTHQTQIRSESYAGLVDAIHNNEGPLAGRRVVLPSSFTGSPRYTIGLYHDAMCIVRSFGRPHLFITLTCNPNWPEISSALQPGQTPVDRPDIVCRVFHLKCKNLIKDIQQGIFGHCLAFVHSIEFQKRGLPHLHMLLILRHDQFTIDQIDSLISAEIPDPNLNPNLFSIVTRCMIHEPCGVHNPSARCMKDGVCTKRFPKDFSSVTTITDNTYPQYKRRPPSGGGNSFTKRKRDGTNIIITNQWVVPYCPWLTCRYDAHINVEYCASIKAVKYLYKYIFKGHDRALLSLHNPITTVNQQQTTTSTNCPTSPIDEIVEYTDSRYVGCTEAVWRIYKFPLHDRSHSVVRLPVHLPDHQQIQFDDGQFIDAMLRGPPSTKLTAYFQTNSAQNQHNQLARSIHYTDFPKYFTWIKSSEGYTWSPRRRPSATTIGRMWMAHPGEGERFYLRLLLLHIRGSVSFIDLRTINGVTYNTFKEACLALNLLEDDNEWDRCLQDASLTASSPSLRCLFTIILLFCQPANPLQLLLNHLNSLSEDISYNLLQIPSTDQPFPEHLHDFLTLCVLHDISYRLSAHSKTLSDYSLSDTYTSLITQFPTHLMFNVLNTHNTVQGILQPSYALSASITALETSLTQDQQSVYSAITSSLDNNNGGFFYIDAPGGTGKTHLLNLFLKKAALHQRNGVACATSGIAATLLQGGRTAHSVLKLPIPASPDSICNFTPRSNTGKLLRNAHFIIWDEASMMHRWSLEALDRSLKDLMHTQLLFGGKLLILAGDFRQVTPVLRRAGRAHIVNACICKSPLWNNVTKFNLTTNMRCMSQLTPINHTRLTSFSQWLLDVGNGAIPTPYPFQPDSQIIQLPHQLLIYPQTIDSLIDFVYSDITDPTNYTNPSWFSERAILSATNSIIDELNENITKRIPGQLHTLASVDSVTDYDNSIPVPIEFLNSITPSGLPPHLLHLKINTPIMLLRNLDAKNGHCNGTRYVVTQMIGDPVRLIKATMLTGSHAGTELLIPRIALSPSDSDLPFSFKRRQFPIRPSLCVTINKAQGQSLKKVGVYLPQPVFNHGQLYVAASRVGDPANIKFVVDQSSYTYNTNTNSARNPTTTQLLTTNVVYREILS